MKYPPCNIIVAVRLSIRALARRAPTVPTRTPNTQVVARPPTNTHRLPVRRRSAMRLHRLFRDARPHHRRHRLHKFLPISNNCSNAYRPLLRQRLIDRSSLFPRRVQHAALRPCRLTRTQATGRSSPRTDRRPKCSSVNKSRRLIYTKAVAIRANLRHRIRSPRQTGRASTGRPATRSPSRTASRPHSPIRTIAKVPAPASTRQLLPAHLVRSTSPNRPYRRIRCNDRRPSRNRGTPGKPRRTHQSSCSR